MTQSHHKTMELDPNDLLGKFKFLVDMNKSVKRPKGDTRVIKTEHGWLFPEDIQLHNHKDEWLYAFGSIHIWRTRDLDVNDWELVR